ncbi:MAG: cysteine desulfurase NifS [Acetatifactor sp.]
MIYLDNAATTKPYPEAVDAMMDTLTEQYGNPSAIYSLGSGAKKRVNQAKRTIAATIGAKPTEVFFTSGGTESDNWALRCVCEAYGNRGKHIITTRIEHHAILHTCEYLEKQGFEVTYLEVNSFGLVSAEDVKKAIRPDTILISVMFANNEIGTILPVEEIGALAKERGILFHTDAVQAYGHLPIQVEKLHIDLLSASGHKFHGPKGVGFLYVRSGVMLSPLLYGGAQERGLRPGTENVPGIAGMEAAAKLATDRMEENSRREEQLRDHLIARLEKEIPHCILNGDREKRLPGNVNVTFPGLPGETIVLMLSHKGICASSGSACTSGEVDPSHVGRAIGLNERDANSMLRLTLSAENTSEELDAVVEELKGIVEKLRGAMTL